MFSSLSSDIPGVPELVLGTRDRSPGPWDQSRGPRDWFRGPRNRSRDPWDWSRKPRNRFTGSRDWTRDWSRKSRGPVPGTLGPRGARDRTRGPRDQSRDSRVWSRDPGDRSQDPRTSHKKLLNFVCLQLFRLLVAVRGSSVHVSATPCRGFHGGCCRAQ